MTAPTDLDPPPLCGFAWRQGISRKRHVCNLLNYPGHGHVCCCGTPCPRDVANQLAKKVVAA